MTDNEINNKTQRQMLMDLTVSAAVQGSKLDTVITTLKEHCENEAEWRETHNTTISVMKSEIAVLKIKAGAWGMAGGAIPLIIMILIDLLRATP
jgi:hypothetical protein